MQETVCTIFLFGGTEMELKIEYLPIKALKPYEKNTRKHQKKDVDNIARSIEKYGMCDAIGIWGEQNIIVEGHGRMLACKQLGMTEVPCVRLDHLTDEQRREYAIAHNATAELSIWDKDFLAEELAELDLSDFDFEFGLNGEKDKEEIEGEVPFTEVLGEENNYIVLKFDNTVDWLQLESVFDLPKVNAYLTNKEGKQKKSTQMSGIGRVVDGADFLNRLGVDL
jgi:hypothetical protein